MKVAVIEGSSRVEKQHCPYFHFNFPVFFKVYIQTYKCRLHTFELRRVFLAEVVDYIAVMTVMSTERGLQIPVSNRI